MKLKKRMAKAFALNVLRVSMIFMLIGWISLWILKPTNTWTKAWRQAEDSANNTFFHYYGLNFAVLSFPVIALAMVGLIYVTFKPQHLRSRQRETRSIAITSPLIISRFIGIISCFEILAVLLFLLFLAWTFYARVSNDFRKLTPVKSMRLELWQLKYLRVANRFGLLAEACLALLLLPILRGLSVFRLLNIQFEASVRYHIWLGTAMIFLALFHGGSTLFIWGVSHHIGEELWKWQKTGRIYIAGLIALVAGLLMWVTSLPQIRRKKFEAFYYTHHLYTVFLVFFLFHAGDRHFYWILPGVFLFGLDKILRIIQSTSETCILAARVFPCKVVELVLPKDPRLTYAPSSTIFVKVACISQFQWHPFTVTSSSMADKHKMSLMVKCGGGWTSALYNTLQAALNSDTDHKTTMRLRVEGPYGPASVDFLRYESLLLVAGGVGITPFLSILQEISCARSNNMFRFPARIQLLFAVKTCQDISMLVPVSSILLNPPENIHLKLKIFITQEKHSTATLGQILTQSQVRTVHLERERSRSAILGPESSRRMAALVGITSAVFLVLLIGLSHVFMHDDKKEKKGQSMRLAVSGGNKTAEEKGPSWVADLVIIASYFAAITVGGLVAIMLQLRRQRKEARNTSSEADKVVESNLIEELTDDSLEEHEIHSGGRPDFEELFADFQKEAKGSNAGVLVCGPESMKQSVASICHKTSQGFIKQGSTKTRMNVSFHSLNFNL